MMGHRSDYQLLRAYFVMLVFIANDGSNKLRSALLVDLYLRVIIFNGGSYSLKYIV